MGVRYLFTTSGRYAGFLAGDHLFGTEASWLGFLRNGNEIYSGSGHFLGYVTGDDRLVRNTSEPLRLPLPPPIPPIPPVPPVPPLPRLPMPPVPAPYLDVFENFGVTAAGTVPRRDLRRLDVLEGASLVAADGVYLGIASRNHYHPDSIANQYGRFGNRYSHLSILNQYSHYGSRYSPLSPFNPYSTTPPRFVRADTHLGFLSANRHVQSRVDADEFVLWLRGD
jgi:hypothetical protein